MEALRVATTSAAIIALAGGLLVAGGCARGSPANNAPPFGVEKPAMMLRGTARPAYPEELIPTGDTGTVVVRVVVLVSGRIDMKKVEVVSSPHPAFTRAVIKALPGYRFVPAEVNGKLIPMTLTVPFAFVPIVAAPAKVPPPS